MAIVEKEKFPDLQTLLKSPPPDKSTLKKYPHRDVVIAKTIKATSGGRSARRRVAREAKFPWQYYKEISRLL